MPAVRLAVVGGGSAYMTFMFRSLADLARDDGAPLAGTEVVLMDVNSENLRLVADWARLTAGNLDLKLTVKDTSDLVEAVSGADFVLSTFRSGGLEGRYLDEIIPLKYDLLGQETTGVGGIFMALRAIPEAVKVAQTVRKHAPEAWIINYTNPTNFICDAMRRAADVKVIGLCDGVYGVMWLMAYLLGMPLERAPEIEAYVAGLNHCTWSLALRHDGRDLYPELPRLIDEKRDVIASLDYSMQDAVRLYRYYDLMPGSLYYTRYYYNLHKVINFFKDPDFQHRSQFLKEKFQKVRERLVREIDDGKPTFGEDDVEDASHGDQAIGCISAIANDSRKLEVVNVPNNGSVGNLPRNAIVEVTGVLGRHGAYPLALGPLPKSVHGVVMMVLEHEELTVEAALEGDRKKVIQAALAHPCVRDFDRVEPLVDEMFHLHKDFLPQFK